MSMEITQHGAIEEHVQFAPVDGSPEARLLNLERQANFDHKYLVNIRKVVNEILVVVPSLDVRQKEATQMNLQLRQEVFKIRDGVPEVVQQQLKPTVDGMPALIQEMSNNLLAPSSSRRSTA